MQTTMRKVLHTILPVGLVFALILSPFVAAAAEEAACAQPQSNIINFWEQFKANVLSLAAILTAIATIGKVVKPLRERVIKRIRATLRVADEGQITTIEDNVSSIYSTIAGIESNIEDSRQCNKALIRDAITRIFYKYSKRQAIPAHEKENMAQLYDVYLKYNGNSYVSDLMKIASEWEVICGDDSSQIRTK